VLIRGLPGSGKSTLAREMVAEGFEHFEADIFFVVDG
jgi:adenylate kinase family enzyme